MADLPVMLKVAGRRCVVVGGGPTAVRRAASLRAAGARVTLIAPRVETGADLAETLLLQRAYQPGDLHEAFLVVIATDQREVNEQAAREAQQVGALVNRADDPDSGDLTIPAHAQHGAVTLAVHTGGISAAAAAAIRRELSDALDPDWPRLLEIAAPFRARIQEHYPDSQERQRMLIRLTDEQAWTVLKQQGPDALEQHLRTLLPSPSPRG